MDRKAVHYTVRLFTQKFIALLCYLLGSRWVITWQISLYFGLGFLLTVISTVIIHKKNPEVLSERGKVMTDSPRWDKVLLSVFLFLYLFAVYFIAGLEKKNAITQTVLFWHGIVLAVFSAAITTAAISVNNYHESTARIQTERNQTVVNKGVYSIVRHPTYSSVLISCVSTCLVFPVLLVFITSFIIAIIIIARTYLEDKMLRENLPGYKEYSQNTRYRLIPFIW